MKKSDVLLFVQHHAWPIAVVIGLCVAIVGWTFLIRPMAAQIMSDRVTHNERIATLDRLKQDEAIISRLTKSVASVSPEEFTKISRIVPRERDVPRLILELEALASETGILLKDVGVAEGKGEAKQKDLPADLRTIDLVVTVTGGDYATLKRFLEAIENNIRLLDVQSFSFSRGLQFYTINLRAYYRTSV